MTLTIGISHEEESRLIAAARRQGVTPTEIEEARREFEEFKENVNAKRRRADARIVYPWTG